MTAKQILQAMCARHGLPVDYGDRLLPLVRRALESPDEVQRRILDLVDRNLAQKSDGPDDQAVLKDSDGAVLVAVARVLHDWDPSTSVLDLGRRLEHLSGEGEEDS